MTPPEIYMGIKHGILTPRFFERNIFWCTGQLILSKIIKIVATCQLSDFKAKMHQIRFRLGLCPRPRWGAYSAPPDHLAGFKGLPRNVQGAHDFDPSVKKIVPVRLLCCTSRFCLLSFAECNASLRGPTSLKSMDT